MATSNFRVVGHFTDATGKTLPQYAPIQARVTAAIIQSITGDWRPDPSSIASVLSAHGLIPAGATLAIDGVANLDRQHIDGNILT